PEMKIAAMVVTPQAISEMIRARRSASRCSMTDMRSSSTGARARGPRCRTLSSRATGTALVRGGFGLGRRALGGALGGGLWLGLRGVGDLVRQVICRLAELPHRFADGAAGYACHAHRAEAPGRDRGLVGKVVPGTSAAVAARVTPLHDPVLRLPEVEAVVEAVDGQDHKVVHRHGRHLGGELDHDGAL